MCALNPRGGLVDPHTVGLLYEAGTYPSSAARDEIRFTEPDLRNRS